MIFSRDYSRAILNLKQEDGAALHDSGIFGRVVIEIKEGRGEIMLYAKGIEGGAPGSLYLICSRGEKFIPLKAVLVNINEGAAALKWRFNPDNISGSGLKIEDVCVIAVINGKGQAVLSAFCGKKVNRWKEGLFSSGIKALSGESVKGDEAEKVSVCLKKPETKETESEKKPEIKAGGKAEEKADQRAGEDERVIKFTEAVNRFQKELDELRYYAYMEKADREEKENSLLSFDTDYIFRSRPGYDFKERNGDFRKINLNDLCLIDDYMYKYANNPTVRAAYGKYKHLLLGREGGELLFCLPDTNREFKDAGVLGFTEFEETAGSFGYRIMKIAKEKETNENPKEKLDGGRA